MAISFCALLFRKDDLDDRALSHGMAVALAGWDVPSPSLEVSELAGLEWSVAFYRSGAKGMAKASEADHLRELFDDELPPGLAVRDAAENTQAVIYTLIYSDEIVLDDAAKFSSDSMARRFVRDGDEGIEALIEDADQSELEELDLPESGPVDEQLRPHRGSTYLAQELGTPILPLLVRALFEGGRRIAVRFFEPGEASVERETRGLNAVLGRVDGRGTFTPPQTIGGICAPPSYLAFVHAYDFGDPADPRDLYRELSIGNIEGTLHFHRRETLLALENDTTWKRFAASGYFPIATIGSSSLGGMGGREKTLALGPDGDRLVTVGSDREREAGPTFAELLRYLTLGWKTRDDVEEDLIVALMMRAKLRVEQQD